MSHSSFENWKAVLEDPESQLPQGMLMSSCDTQKPSYLPAYKTAVSRRDEHSPVAYLLRHRIHWPALENMRTAACMPIPESFK